MKSHTYTVAPKDQADHELGLELIRVLQLRTKRENGRVDTTHGDKNPCGLTRTVRTLSASPLEKAAPDLLEHLIRLVNICTHPLATKEEMRTIAKEAREVIVKATTTR